MVAVVEADRYVETGQKTANVEGQPATVGVTRFGFWGTGRVGGAEGLSSNTSSMSASMVSIRLERMALTPSPTQAAYVS